MNLKQENRDNIFHERISILRDHGYRGFTVNKIQQEWENVQVTAQNSRGRTLTGSGDTKEEAYQKLIEKIDQALEIP